MFFVVYILILFLINGFLVGIADFWIDVKKKFHLETLLIVLIFSLLAVYLIFLSKDAAAILLAIALGNLVAGKVDNKYFILSCLIVSITGIFSFFLDRLNLFAFFILFLASILDELMHEASSEIRFPRILEWFFKYRFIMKFSAIGLWLLDKFGFLFLVSFFLWDLGYEIGSKFYPYIYRN